MTTVVLGWDGLDYDLLERFGLHERFGEQTARIETLVNPELEKPHTWELWPSIITGVGPGEHGIHAHEYIETNWSNPLLRTAARLSTPIPDSLRWRVGRAIRGAGATMDFEDAEYYARNNLSTVFDGRDAFPLAIPNYRSDVDKRFGMTPDRGAELGEFMAVTTDETGETRREPTVAPDTFAARIAADASEKIGLVRHAIHEGYDLVFVWLAYVDTAGHVAPTVNDPDRWMRQTYEAAADFTEFVRSQLGSDDTLICLSDHGLQDGEHTDFACVGAWPGESVRNIESVLDVANTIDAVTPSSASRSAAFETDDSEAAAVRERLEKLGYV